MPKDDYHVIAYKILAYLYVQLKAGADIDPLCPTMCTGGTRTADAWWSMTRGRARSGRMFTRRSGRMQRPQMSWKHAGN